MSMVGGFFDLGVSTAPVKKKKVFIKNGCDVCKLHLNCKTPKMEVQGNGEKGILIIGEKPTTNDDTNNRYFSGESGKFIRDALRKNNLSLDRDCWSINAISCHSPDDPTPDQLANCRNILLDAVERLQPKVVITLGTGALKGLIGHRIDGRISKVKTDKFFGFAIPDRVVDAWICPTYSCTYLNQFIVQKGRNQGKMTKPDMALLFNWHIEQAVKKLDEDFPELPTDVHTTMDVQEAITWIKNARASKGKVSFDYETYSIKPHREDTKIRCTSIAVNNVAYAFPMFKNKEFQREWMDMLLDDEIETISHNSSFEDSWTAVKCGEYPSNTTVDTCIAGHALQNKTATGLKFWVYILLGIIGYDDEADPYITRKSEKEDRGNNTFNSVMDAPLSMLLRYCGLDSLYTGRVEQLQSEMFAKKPTDLQYWWKRPREGCDLFVEGVHALAQVKDNGMLLDPDILEQSWNRLTKRINLHLQRIQQTEEFQTALKLKGGAINVGSDTQLAEVLYTYLKYPKPKEGQSQTDADQLKRINTPLTQEILKWKKYGKVRDTYLAQFRREQVNNIIYPDFNLQLVDTFRSSSSNPNFQNIPKRDAEAKRITREIIIPREGNCIFEVDFGQIEVRIAAAYTQDPNLIKYCSDPSTDMHRDSSMDIYLMDASEVKATGVRSVIKNSFVFPEFYGSSVKPGRGEIIGNITNDCWRGVSEEVHEHLASKGIKNIKDFQAHMEDIENKFWNERFGVYSDWKDKVWADYQQFGFIDSKTGFRYFAPMKKTEATNYPIQGSAFHCTLKVIIETHKKVKELSGRSFYIGQIHDAIVGEMHKSEVSEVLALLQYHATDKVREDWDWINVPLTMEAEISKTREEGGSFAHMALCAELNSSSGWSSSQKKINRIEPSWK